MKQRINIGLFVDDLDAVFTSDAVKGAELGAIAIDANMFIFPGMYLDNADISEDHIRYEFQYNLLFDFVDKNSIDVLYIMMGMIGSRVDEEERYKFLEKYLGIPVVIMYTTMEGYPSVIFDNVTSFKNGIKHLIIDHSVTKVGYISGPKTNVDAMERLKAYKLALAETGIEYNEDYVIYGNFEESSESRIAMFVKEHPEVDAIVFANDRMARGGYIAFSKLGIIPGVDIKVVSFDNSDFSASLNPPLTTVEANGAELAYKAIIAAENVAKTGTIEDIAIETHLVMRASCGCNGFQDNTLSKRLGLRKLMEEDDVLSCVDVIQSYLFSDYITGPEISVVKEGLDEFISYILRLDEDGDFEGDLQMIKNIFEDLIAKRIHRYTSVEQITNIMVAIQNEVIHHLISDVQKQFQIAELFSSLYRYLAVKNWQGEHVRQIGVERMNRQINMMTSDMFRMDAGEQIPYNKILKNLSTLGVNSSYLYTFNEPIKHRRQDAFEVPETLRFRAYFKDEKSYAVPDQKSVVKTGSIFVNQYMPKYRRTTFVLSPLFSGEDIYGIFLAETSYENFKNMAPISMQISAAVKSIILLEQQEEVQRKLEENLQKISANNDMLTAMSKTDQLTGLYNRWGYLEHIKNIIEDDANTDKKILVMYGDMDNLKYINDNYGHDVGDIALKGMAVMLRRTFSESDIVSRFGGDEFVAFSIVSETNNESTIRAKLKEILDYENLRSGRPFDLSISMGFSEVACSKNINIFEVLAEADRKLYAEKSQKKQKAKKNGAV